MYKFELEKGSKKYTYPNCGAAKKYRRFVSIQTGEYAPFEFGKCDRENSCDYFLYPTTSKNYVYIGSRQKNGVSNYPSSAKNGTRAAYEARNIPKKPDYVPNDVLLRTLTNYKQNAFVQFLLRLFPESFDAVQKSVKDYRIGTTKTGKTIFWQIDHRRKVRTGKIIAYDGETGKRRKDVFPNWTHAELKKKNLLKPDFNLKQCFFGEHLLIGDESAPLAIVEAEKTAVICSILFPEFVWLAVGSKQSLKPERLKRLGRTRKIVLYPDADGFSEWQKTADKARSNGQSVRVSDLIEKLATDAEKDEGFDLADYLISRQVGKLHRQKEFIEFYNEKLEKVLNDEKLFADFETILDEQKAVLMINGKLSEPEAESQVMNFDNLREIVVCV